MPKSTSEFWGGRRSGLFAMWQATFWSWLWLWVYFGVWTFGMQGSCLYPKCTHVTCLFTCWKGYINVNKWLHSKDWGHPFSQNMCENLSSIVIFFWWGCMQVFVFTQDLKCAITCKNIFKPFLKVDTSESSGAGRFWSADCSLYIKATDFPNFSSSSNAQWFEYRNSQKQSFNLSFLYICPSSWKKMVFNRSILQSDMTGIYMYPFFISLQHQRKLYCVILSLIKMYINLCQT